MEDDNGLELSLGLSYGTSSAKSKGKVGSSSDTRLDETDRGNTIPDEFNNFFKSGMQKQDPDTGSQIKDSIKPQENFFNSLTQPAQVAEERRPEMNNKRKMFFDEMNQQKKLDTESKNLGEFNDQARTSHISITTEEDGSTGDNEDVADSEVDGSTSNLACSGVELQGQKGIFSISSENDFNRGSLTYGGLPYTVQQHTNMISAPPSNHVGSKGNSNPLSGMIHMNGDRPANSGDLQLAFGYPPVQLPVLDRDRSWGITHSQQRHPPFTGMGAGGVVPNSGTPYDGLKLSQGTMEVAPPNSSDPTKGDGKNYATEEGTNTNNINFRATDTSDRPKTVNPIHESSSIRPGAAADIKYGGSGSVPNLPWVSTTAPGPNGRTISGVTYRFSGNQIKIVCACHGSHMSPEEFIRHASEELPKQETGNLAAFPTGSPPTSAQT